MFRRVPVIMPENPKTVNWVANTKHTTKQQLNTPRGENIAMSP